jgi:uncharacterized protein YcaQ
MDEISLREARAMALRAQGFGQRWSRRDPSAVLERLGVIQLDGVNVIARSQDLVPFARVGPTPVERMHRAIYRERRGFEYWGHEASWLPIGEYRWWLPRMLTRRTETRPWWREARRKFGHMYDEVLARVREEGPLAAAAFAGAARRRGPWWDWSPAKFVLEDLLDQGLVMAAARTAGFARLYDVPERVLPRGIDLTDPGPEAAARHMLRGGFHALGVATARDAADYFRQRQHAWKPALAALLEAGDVVPVKVEGWDTAAYATPAALARTALSAHRPAVLSPFDNLVWDRARTERLFGFHYRIEIYTPAPKRKFGYYVLPLLARGLLAGRADIKMDRHSETLLVHGFWLEEPSVEPADAATALADLARHLGAARVTIARAQPRGLLARLRAATRAALTS